jgi:hypothetical protein
MNRHHRGPRALPAELRQTEIIRVLFTPGARAELEAVAESQDMSLSDFVRQSLKHEFDRLGEKK